MTSNQQPTVPITEKGRQLLTLIRDAGSDGISRKEISDAFKRQLNDDDHSQLDSLAAQGLITAERVDIVDHPDVEYVYRAAGLSDHSA